MNAKDAAEKIRPTFHLHSMPPDARHHVKFIEDVATELGVEHTPFNLHQVAEAIDEAGIERDSLEYPKMLFSRRHHAVKDIEASVYLPRHDCVAVHVANEDQAKELGSGFVDDIAQLPPRGDTPITAEMPAAGPLHEVDPADAVS